LKTPRKTLIVILGPTASGKTGLAIELAQELQTEIISADSRQFYKEIPIGTAAPTDAELKKVKHHFVGNLSIEDSYNVSAFEQDALKVIEKGFHKLDQMIMVGGSGLYLDAVCKGIDELPDPDPELRSSLNTLYGQQGIEALQQKLKILDHAYYEKVDKQNPKRLLRALEVCLQTGKTYTELRLNKTHERDFNILKIGLDIPREQLNQRINQRADLMLKAGWIEEAKRVFPKRELNALNTVGFKELFNYLSGEWELTFAIEKIKTNTRRFAKRQMTWFRKDPEINWFKPGNKKDIFQFIQK
jgi:tRNA dimethylallyltransferase